MRFGLLLGFLVGAAIASLLASSDVDELAAEGATTPSGATAEGGLVDKLKRQAEEARAAAREASEQKQAEMLRDWQQARGHDATDN
ncbi:MAG TPA: hypothetical protein VFS30_15350 [Dehalococcoidia bacterium]|nr:hypothetical protein [Dehalococcoidia bacterium]